MRGAGGAKKALGFGACYCVGQYRKNRFERRRGTDHPTRAKLAVLQMYDCRHLLLRGRSGWRDRDDSHALGGTHLHQHWRLALNPGKRMGDAWGERSK